MSQENVEVIRPGFEAWNAGDMYSTREVCDPDLIMRGPFEFFWDHAEALETLG
jgi:ketosteroid isomerase-like protein